MFGLVKKDLFVIKHNLKVVFAIFVALLFLSFQEGDGSAIFILPMIGVILFISTFSYDEFNHCNSYIVALPDGRRNAIKAKYLATILIICVLAFLSLVTTTLINYFQGDAIHFNYIMEAFMGTILSTSLLVFLLYPVMIQFGAVNGRIIVFVVIIGIAIIGTILSRFMELEKVLLFINSLEVYWMILVPVISVLLLGISYLISSRLFLKKEF